MLFVSTSENKLLDHHDKAYKYFTTYTNYLPEGFKNLNVVVSGSYCITSAFAPQSKWSDQDFYFLNQKSLDQAFALLDESSYYTLLYNTENAYTFICQQNGYQVQLVKKIYPSVYKTITAFDFSACAIAFDFFGTIYFTQETIYSWANKSLIFNDITFWQNMSPEKFKEKAPTLIHRLLKYSHRYNFKISKQIKDFLSQKISYDSFSQILIYSLSKNSSGIVSYSKIPLDQSFINDFKEDIYSPPVLEF